MSTYQELLAQKQALAQAQAELEKLIADQLAGQRAEVIAQIKSLMAEHGLTIADLGTGAKPGRKPRAEADSPRKVAAKYRNTETGESWTGRGLKPKWLSAALAAGKTLEDFAV